MQFPIAFVSRMRSSLAAPPQLPTPPLVPFRPRVLRGVSQRSTIRACAARVIAVTALQYAAELRDR